VVDGGRGGVEGKLILRPRVGGEAEGGG